MSKQKTTVWVQLMLFPPRGGVPTVINTSFQVNVLPTTAANFRRLRAILADKIRGIRDSDIETKGAYRAKARVVGWDGPILIRHREGSYLVMPKVSKFEEEFVPIPPRSTTSRDRSDDPNNLAEHE